MVQRWRVDSHVEVLTVLSADEAVKVEATMDTDELDDEEKTPSSGWQDTAPVARPGSRWWP